MRKTRLPLRVLALCPSTRFLPESSSVNHHEGRHSSSILKRKFAKISNSNSAFVESGYKQPPLSIYIHWPYCAKICPYCDFNRYLMQSDTDHKRMLDCYRTELNYFRTLTPDSVVQSIFFGGGTPSLAPPSTIGGIIDHVTKTWPITNDIEITMEANPTSVEAKKLRDFRAAGVNRLSLGVQSLNDQDLKFLGRGHSAEEAMTAIGLAKAIFPRSSFDLIYARHRDQSPSSWEQELKRALSFGTEHLSLYSLTIEKGTPFHKRVYQPAAPTDALIPVDEELGADLYQITTEVTAAHGFEQYEVSNFAKPGKECRHNLAYWQSHDWVGCGPGAAGRITFPGTNTRESFIQAKLPTKWIEEIERNGHATQERTKLTQSERLSELFLNGLRTTHGVTMESFNFHSQGKAFYDVLNEKNVKEFVKNGLLEIEPTIGIRPTKKGLAVLDAMLPRILV